MLTPKKMNKLAQNKIVDMYTKLNEELTNEIMKKINKAGNLTEYTKHQIRVLINQGGKEVFEEALRKTNKVSKKTRKEVDEIFNELKDAQTSGYKSMYDYNDIDYDISENSQQLIDSVVRRTNKNIRNLTKSIAFATKREYIKAIDELYLKVATGSVSYDKAIKSTLTDLSNKGITLQSKGRNYTIEGMVKNNLFTALRQTANEISSQIKDDIKADAVWISVTPYCRPSHIPINGVVMDLDKFKKNYEYLTQEPNCYHIVNYVVKDIFEPPLEKDYIRRVNRNAKSMYEARQKQNYLARQVRQKKKEISSIKTSSKLLNLKKRKELRLAQAKYRTFSEAKGLRVDYLQTWEAGYNKPV